MLVLLLLLQRLVIIIDTATTTTTQPHHTLERLRRHLVSTRLQPHDCSNVAAVARDYVADGACAAHALLLQPLQNGGAVPEDGRLGFGVWGLGFGVWGLGFGVWGLGFRV